MTPEQYEHWHLRTCARCGRRAAKSANWPDGPICRTCYTKAAQTRGCCAACGTERLLPGRDPDGAAICRDCAGITRDFSCDRCGFEGLLHTGRLCTRCTITDRLSMLLDDGTGTSNKAMLGLVDVLVAEPKPRSVLQWLDRTHVRTLLADLATGRVPLTHEALHTLPNWRTAAHIRDLLMTAGALPVVDKQLLLVETWLHHKLADVDGVDENVRLLRQFATWEQLPRLRARAQRRPLTVGARRFAGTQFTRAHGFLVWLAERDCRLADVSQTDIDTWYATHGDYEKHALHAFLAWAIRNGHMPKHRLPRLQPRRNEPITQHRRLALLRRILDDDCSSLRSRVAACLILLYAQPVSRIVRVNVDDIVEIDSDVFIRLGDPPSPVPEPFAALLLELRDHRHAPPGCRWLFPGHRAGSGQPVNPSTLQSELADLGIPAIGARTAALRQLVLQAPAAVVADSLGFHQITAHRHLADAGGTWNRYAPGDHARPAADKATLSPQDASKDSQ